MKKSFLNISLLLSIQSLTFFVHGGCTLESSQVSPNRSENPLFYEMRASIQAAESALHIKKNEIEVALQAVEAEINEKIANEQSMISETEVLLTEGQKELKDGLASFGKLQQQLASLSEKVEAARGALLQLESNTEDLQAKIKQGERAVQALSFEIEEKRNKACLDQENERKKIEEALLSALKELSYNRKSLSQPMGEAETSILPHRVFIATAVTAGVAALLAFKK